MPPRPNESKTLASRRSGFEQSLQRGLDGLLARPCQRPRLFVAAAISEDAVGAVVSDAAFAVARDAGERIFHGDLLYEELELDERLAGQMHEVDVADPQSSRLSNVAIAQALAEAGEHRGGSRVGNG